MVQRRLPTFFQAVCIGISLIAVIILLAVFLGLILFSSPDALIASLLSEEIWYAIRLSIITAVISTLICLIIAVPIAYSMTRFSFFWEAVGKRSPESSPLSPTARIGRGIVDFSLSGRITSRSVFHQYGNICRLHTCGNHHSPGFCKYTIYDQNRPFHICYDKPTV